MGSWTRQRGVLETSQRKGNGHQRTRNKVGAGQGGGCQGGGVGVVTGQGVDRAGGGDLTGQGGGDRAGGGG